MSGFKTDSGETAKVLPPGLVEELGELAETFLQSLPESIDTIEDLLRVPDRNSKKERITESIILAHRIRGTAGTLGLSMVSASFAVLEDQLKLVQQRNLLEDQLALTGLKSSIALCRKCCGAADANVLEHRLEASDSTVRLLTNATAAELDEVEKIRENSGQLVLLIEDDPFFISIIQSVLSSDEHFNKGILSARSLAEAAKFLNNFEPDIILLDLALPDSEGIRTFHAVHDLAPEVPILILTALDDTPLADESVACGAQDYLVKGRISPDALTRCIRYSIARFRAEKSVLRLRAIEDFHSALAHDLRVPVQGADRILEHILAGNVGELTAELRNAILVLNDSNKVLLNRLNKLLNLYRVEFGSVDAEWRLTNPLDIVNAVIAERQNDIQKKELKVEIFQSEVEPSLHTDPELLREVIDELISNAVKFATTGDTISVRMETSDTRVSIKISNPGHYIAQEDKRDLFRKFWRGTPGKSYVATSGLGLYYCQQIMNVLNGTIACRSNPDLTTFTVRLPVSIGRG
ncbi:response regulator [Candidatus Obscuribacterales bacterium]|nr:response regulator [Candidatus Obscuribacterales bacterium]MBX3150550.1 response regulator [Candidatus Obscuribacterales bacterium]